MPPPLEIETHIKRWLDVQLVDLCQCVTCIYGGSISDVTYLEVSNKGVP